MDASHSRSTASGEPLTKYTTSPCCPCPCPAAPPCPGAGRRTIDAVRIRSDVNSNNRKISYAPVPVPDLALVAE